VERLFKLPPEAFNPPPKVHSAVVRIKINPQFEALQVDESGFFEYLKQSFGQKRKTLFNNLREQYDKEIVKQAMAKAKVAPDIRAEAVSLEKSAQIYRSLIQQGRP